MASNWYNKYYNKNKLISNKYDNYLNYFKKIDNFKKQINKIELSFNKDINELKKNGENINNFINIYKNKKSLEILQKEAEIIRLLSKYSLQNNNMDYNFFYNSISLLINLSNLLQDNLKQPILKHNDYDIKEFIPRCSYKFCNFKGSCGYNYNNNSTICYQDHYVHNMVSADLYVLLEYIKLFKNENKLIHNKEILKSINTLSFVINHMEKELKSKCLYQDKSDWNKFHFTKKVVNKIIKKK